MFSSNFVFLVDKWFFLKEKENFFSTHCSVGLHCSIVFVRKSWKRKGFVRSRSFVLICRISANSSATIFSNRRRTPRKCFSKFNRTYRRLCSTVLCFIRLFLFVKRLMNRLTNFLEKISRIIFLVHGWIEMVRSIFVGLHLLLTCLMNLIFKSYQIFELVTNLFEPFSNRTLEKAARSFSILFYDFYSSNGACYSLKARTRHFFKRFRARWKLNSMKIYRSEDEIFYDALNDFNF